MFRKAVLSDTDRIEEIYLKIHAEEACGRSTIGWVQGVYPVRETALRAIELGEMFVEDLAGTLVAAGILNQRQVPEYADCPWGYAAPDEQVMVLHTLVVDPAQKGRGYGKAFVAFYEHYALEHGCPYLRIDTQVKNRSARAMYAKLGYREAGVVSCNFNGIADVQMVCLEKKLPCPPEP